MMSSADANVETISVSDSPSLRTSHNIDLWEPDLEYPVAVSSDRDSRRKSLNEILTGLSPEHRNHAAPDKALKWKMACEQHQRHRYDIVGKTTTYDEVMHQAQTRHHEHLEEDTRKRLAAPPARQCACDFQARIWNWLKVAF